MRFKIDENLHPDAATVLSEGGHEVSTVRAQGLRGALDDELAAVCKREDRVLVTLDLDFADIRGYPPHESPGILVLRLRKQDKASVLAVLRRLLPVLERTPPHGALWVVDEAGIRVRGEEIEDNG